MTVQVEHTVVLSAPIEDVWDFISDPERRADAISVVDSYDLEDEAGRRATWQIEVPVPMVSGTVTVETEERERHPPNYVKFVGRSKVVQVVGEHELEAVEDGTRLTNRFVVDGRVPGIESFFKRNLQSELENLMNALGAELDVEVRDVEGIE